jgi:hypothetical protein
MSFIPRRQTRVATVTTPKPWVLSAIDGGVNLEDMEFKLKDNQSPKALNVWYNNRCLSKRWGRAKFSTLAAGSTVWAVCRYGADIIAACGTGLYRINPTTGAATLVYTGLSDRKGFFFRFGQYLYYLNGAQYMRWDGATMAAVTPYIPTVVLNRTPTGGGAANEDYNRLGAGFRNSFNGNGSATLYQLTDIGLDATAVTVTIGGVAKTEGTHFTVDRTAGTMNFAAGTTPAGAPANGSNNVVITAYKTVSAQISSFMTCTRAMAFGGLNDTRLFFCGNGTALYFWSNLLDPTYVPLSQYNQAGGSDDPVVCFSKQYDRLFIFKPREIGAVSYQWDTTQNKAYFPYKNVNPGVGCDAPDTLLLVGNELVWANSYNGVNILVGTDVLEQLNVLGMSRNINGNTERPGLMQQAGIKGATSVYFDHKYWVCLPDTGMVYVWDEGATPYINTNNPEVNAARLSWWIFDGIRATCFLEDAGRLLHGDANGVIWQFIDIPADDGQAFPASWKMAIRDFGAPDWLKTVSEIYVSAFTRSGTSINLRHYTDREPYGIDDSQPFYVASFGWATFTWSSFMWGTINFAKAFRRRPNKKKIVYYGLELWNDTAGEDLSVTDIKIQYYPDSRVK